MSDVKMCDKCADVFSVMEPGWTTSSQTMVQRDEYDRPKTVTVNIGLCPECSPKTGDAVKALQVQRRARRTAMLELAAGAGAVPAADPVEQALTEAERAELEKLREDRRLASDATAEDYSFTDRSKFYGPGPDGYAKNPDGSIRPLTAAERAERYHG